jgi:TRAP-type transport system small permease protein
MVASNVVLHLLNRDLAWVTEFGELLMVWVTFLGGAAAAQRGHHVSIAEVVDKLGPRSRRTWDAVVTLACIGIVGVVTFYGIKLVDGNWNNELTVLHWPMSIQYLGMVLGSSFMLLFLLWDLWQIGQGVPAQMRYRSSGNTAAGSVAVAPMSPAVAE